MALMQTQSLRLHRRADCLARFWTFSRSCLRRPEKTLIRREICLARVTRWGTPERGRASYALSLNGRPRKCREASASRTLGSPSNKPKTVHVPPASAVDCSDGLGALSSIAAASSSAMNLYRSAFESPRRVKLRLITFVIPSVAPKSQRPIAPPCHDALTGPRQSAPVLSNHGATEPQ